jgi:20S proteasome alpha/beta subunit
MTIAIGLICKNAILMDSDSRTTNPDHTIRDNAKKIRFIKMKNLDYAMIAQSGDDDLGSRVVDGIEDMAKDASITDWQSVTEIGNKVISNEIQKLKIPFQGADFDAEKFQKLLWNFDSTFMIAHYHNGNPYIFTTDFYPGRFSRRNVTHYCIGCGSTLANFLLDGFDFSQLEANSAAIVLVYVIEEVKKFDPRCGGQTNIFFNTINKSVGVIIEGKPEILAQPMQERGILHPDAIKEYLNDISDIRSSINVQWQKKLSEIFVRLTVRDIKRRCAPERFIRMRHGSPLVDKLPEHYRKGGGELAKALNEFYYGLGNEMSKADLEKLWDKICRMLPSEKGLYESGAEFFKLF